MSVLAHLGMGLNMSNWAQLAQGAAGGAPAEISLVESGDGSNNNGNDLTVNFSGSLSEGDLVLVFSGTSTDRAGYDPVPSGYTPLYWQDEALSNRAISYKIMGSTPDTSFTITGNGTAQDAQTAVYFVLQNVDTAVLDVPIQASSGALDGNTPVGSLPDPPAITTLHDGCWIFGFVGMRTNKTATVFPAGYTTGTTAGAVETNYSMLSWAYKTQESAGTEDPGEIGGTGTGWDAQTLEWFTYTLALRPLYTGAQVSGGVYGTAGGGLYGFTDFSEFGTASGDIAGITFRGTSGDEEAIRGIANDATEGNYHHYTQAGFDIQMYSLDAFDHVGKIGWKEQTAEQTLTEIELLARIYYPSGSFERNLGPAFRIARNPSATDTARRGCVGFLSDLTPDTTHVYRVQSTSQSLQGGASNPGDPFTTGTWHWVRLRATEDTANSWTFKCSIWEGGLGDEPVSWDLDDSGNALSTTPGELIGWMQIANPKAGSQRIAYLAFSEDPTVTPPPTP